MLGLWLIGVIAFIAFTWVMGDRMGREAGRYATGALADRSERTRDLAWLLAYGIGWALWLPLMIFNRLAFKTAYPVTERRLRPRRIGRR